MTILTTHCFVPVSEFRVEDLDFRVMNQSDNEGVGVDEVLMRRGGISQHL